MNTSGADIAASLLREGGVTLDRGLSDAEVSSIELEFDFTFSTDHRELLQLCLPVGDEWVNWRSPDRGVLKRMMDWPADGLVWDVHNNDFWPRSWGRKPRRASADELEKLARSRIAAVPRLVPLQGNRFVVQGATGPTPVLAVHQADIAVWGDNLPDFVSRTLRRGTGFSAGRVADVPFWSALAAFDPQYLKWKRGVDRLFWNCTIDGGHLLPLLSSTGEPIVYRVKRP